MQAARPNLGVSNISDNLRIRGNFRPRPQNISTGILILHGFTSSLDAVSGIIPELDALNLPWEMPVLRGHAKSYHDLRGVKASDWFDDAAAALHNLAQKADRIIIIGLSMGGLAALNLCARPSQDRNKICGCITWAAALGFCNKLAPFARFIAPFIRDFPAQNSFCDDQCRLKCTNYPRFPVDAFVQLYNWAKYTRKILHNIDVPLCIIHSQKDQVVPFNTSDFLFKHAGSAYCELHALTQSGHELGQDCEAQKVFDLSTQFIKKYIQPL